MICESVKMCGCYCILKLYFISMYQKDIVLLGRIQIGMLAKSIYDCMYVCLFICLLVTQFSIKAQRIIEELEALTSACAGCRQTCFVLFSRKMYVKSSLKTVQSPRQSDNGTFCFQH